MKLNIARVQKIAELIYLSANRRVKHKCYWFYRNTHNLLWVLRSLRIFNSLSNKFYTNIPNY